MRAARSSGASYRAGAACGHLGRSAGGGSYEADHAFDLPFSIWGIVLTPGPLLRIYRPRVIGCRAKRCNMGAGRRLLFRPDAEICKVALAARGCQAGRVPASPCIAARCAI